MSWNNKKIRRIIKNKILESWNMKPQTDYSYKCNDCGKEIEKYAVLICGKRICLNCFRKWLNKKYERK